MVAKFNFMNDLINKNHQSFDGYKDIKWLNPYHAEIEENRREEIVNTFSSKVNWSFKKTKPWINHISKGCELCGQGEWSCLFITGRCNANCFYCPASQNSDDTPMAQQLTFENPEEYADFINYFNFKGCSFSGGEPFLAFEKVLGFLETLRKKCAPDLYIWMYTNGILGSEDKYRKLADLGINEVRFDIGATNYKIDTIKKASGIIDNITVEIPMDPNKTELLKKIISELEGLGVTNLNLHQMRLTKYNADKLLAKDYTFLHGEHPTVLESELAALEIINFVDSKNYKIGINYCSFQYKNRFQKAGYRSKVLNKIIDLNEITENGYVLNLYLSKKPVSYLKALTADSIPELIKTGTIQKSPVSEFLKNYKKYEFAIIDFYGMAITDNTDISSQSEFINITNRKFALEIGRPASPFIIVKEKFEKLIELIMGNYNHEMSEDEDLFWIWRYYFIEQGFRSYF
jgi:uncharacterized protein